MTRNVADITTIELKATAFDITKQLQFLQNQLGLIEQELIKRAQAEQESAQEQSNPSRQRISDLPTMPPIN